MQPGTKPLANVLSRAAFRSPHVGRYGKGVALPDTLDSDAMVAAQFRTRVQQPKRRALPGVARSGLRRTRMDVVAWRLNGTYAGCRLKRLYFGAGARCCSPLHCVAQQNCWEHGFTSTPPLTATSQQCARDALKQCV